MRITKNQLKRIIKEEIKRALYEISDSQRVLNIAAAQKTRAENPSMEDERRSRHARGEQWEEWEKFTEATDFLIKKLTILFGDVANPKSPINLYMAKMSNEDAPRTRLTVKELGRKIIIDGEQILNDLKRNYASLRAQKGPVKEVKWADLTDEEREDERELELFTSDGEIPSTLRWLTRFISEYLSLQDMVLKSKPGAWRGQETLSSEMVEVLETFSHYVSAFVEATQGQQHWSDLREGLDRRS